MNRVTTLVITIVIAGMPLACQAKPVSIANSAISTITQLRFNEILEATPKELTLSSKAKALNGKRVRMVGYMANMENPPTGGFYLCPCRVFCDEGGGGTADLPPDSVFVVVSSAKGHAIAAPKHPVEVTGILSTEKKIDAAGHPVAIQLMLDKPVPTRPKTQKPKLKR